jgi:putative DNA methylase
MANGRKTKKEITAELVAEAVSAGKKTYLETVDFSDPNRPLTCLEVDFPILPINQIAQIEGNARKPIYEMSKWWARRRSSVFRSVLIAAAAKAPDDPSEAAKLVWDSYYGNHQENEAFKQLKVADIFMGGGTTLVEGARLGMEMTGNDLNPVAWLVVKNELADVELGEVSKLFDHIENKVKSQVMPFYACEGPNGEKGKWTQISTNKVMDNEFDPLALSPEERADYSYDGPEVIYNFWVKHAPCGVAGCGHRTPLMANPVVAVKTLSVQSWLDTTCTSCGELFDIERKDARMSHGAPLVVAATEKPYAVMNSLGQYECPHCNYASEDYAAAAKGDSSSLPKKLAESKKINLALCVSSEWMQGTPSSDESGSYGGASASDVESTRRWIGLREGQVGLIEVRGELPDEFIEPVSRKNLKTASGNIPTNAKYVCQAPTCGREQPVVAAIEASGDIAPSSIYMAQCFSKELAKSGNPYGGRFFKEVSEADVERYSSCMAEWESRKNTDLEPYWPKSEIPFGHMTHQRQPLPRHGYHSYHQMFNFRQLYVHALILKEINIAYGYSDAAKEQVLGAFQQFLSYENMFCYWHRSRDHFAPHLSDRTFSPKNGQIEVGVFSKVGYGPWRSAAEPILKGLEWRSNPWELVPTSGLIEEHPDLEKFVSGKSEKTYPKDIVLSTNAVTCGSSTEMTQHADGTFDLVITDPPFGGLLHYAELADYFYVWLRLVLKDKYPEYFSGEYTPKTLEAVSNKARHPDDPDAFYKRVLTECWREASRLLKPGGILAFTFHHSEDEPWVDVLESLFDSGYYLEATYPIRSDETKGKGEFGSKTIEYDIIHVCRKRTEEPKKISWARLRRKILADVRQLQGLLEHHQVEGLPNADIQVIKRGKALEYFSKHYGQVYVEEGREFTVNEALVGINQILDDQSESESGGTPVICEPNTRSFLRIFASQSSVDRDQIQKTLRGSGIAPSTFVGLGWATETTRPKAFHWRSPLEIAQERMASSRAASRDFDQAMLLVGACYADSEINAKKLLDENFKPHPALGQLLDWLQHHGADSHMRQASMTARQLYTRWEADHQAVVQQQIDLFGMEDEL